MTRYGASWSTLRPRAGQLLHEPATHEERCVHGAPATAKLSEIVAHERRRSQPACGISPLYVPPVASVL
jgi:hypothetical protein